MTWITPRSARMLFASTLALAALGAASALSAEPAPRDAATGQASGKRMYKPVTATTENALPGSAAACTASNLQPTNVASDPEEGGQVTAARTKSAPTVSELTVSKRADTASTKLMDAAPAPGSGATCPVQR